MLLSFYGSFRWARKENYVLKTAALVIVSSLLSAVFGLHIISVYFGPATLLSFPLYGVWDETMGPPIAGQSYGEWIYYYRMRFLAGRFYAADPVGYESYRVTFLFIDIGSFPHRDFVFIPSAGFFGNVYLFILPLLLFLFMNSLGALAGYLFSKSPLVQKSELRRPGFIAKVALGIILPALAVALPLQLFDAYAFFTFGITWLVIIVGERLMTKEKK